MECEIREGSLFYKRIGDGIPLVLLHGRVGDHRYMEGLFEPLFAKRGGWQRIYLDLPGCGQTRVDESVNSHDRELEVILECIDRIIPGQRFALAGLSYGGYLARGIVCRRMEQLEGLCLIAPRIQQDPAMKDTPEHITLATNEAIKMELDADEIEVFESLVVQSRHGLGRLREHFFPGAAVHDHEHSQRLRTNSRGLSFDADALEQPFEKPTLILTGRQDSTVGYRDAWGILPNYPRATFAVLDRAGHFLGMTEQSELVSALLREWLERVELER
jgi:pimeloyl-ACP methyl ester carboxylesterase